MNETIPAKPYRKHPQYITCGKCSAHVRVEFCAPTVIAGFLQYCPACGSNDLKDVAFNSDQDYWYTLASGFGLPETQAAVTFIRKLYDLWDVTKYRRFRDFVESEAGEVLARIRNQDNTNA